MKTTRRLIALSLLIVFAPSHAEPPKLTYNALVQIIGQEKITSTRALLEHFKRHEGYSQILSNWIAFYDSESAQQIPELPGADIDPANPRIAIYLDDVVITFTGKKDGPFYDQLEIVNLDAEPDHSGFSSHRRRLQSNAAAKALLHGGGKTCISCHGEVFRPHFPPYDLWPGAYAGFHDQFHVNFRNKENGGEGFEEWKVEKEHSRFEEFLKNKEQHELYGLLKIDAPNNATYEIAENITPDKFNRFLVRHNNQRILALVKKAEAKFAAGTYQYALAFSLMCWNRPISEVFPEDGESRKNHDQALLRALKALYPDATELTSLKVEGDIVSAIKSHTEAINSSDYQRLRNRYAKLNELPASQIIFNDDQEIPPQAVANFRYILEGMGGDARYFSMSFVPGLRTFSFNLGKRDFLDFFSGLFFQDLLERDTALKISLIRKQAIYLDQSWIGSPGYRAKNSKISDICDELKAKSREALTTN